MPPQCVHINEYGSGSGVTALQAHIFAFLCYTIVKNIFVLLPFPICQAPKATFAWSFWGQNDSLGGRHSPEAPGSTYVNMETAVLGAVQHILTTPLEFWRPTRKKNRINGILQTQE